MEVWTLIKEILGSPGGSFASVASVAFLVILGSVKLGGIIEKYKVVDKLDGAIDNIRQDIASIKGFMETIRNRNTGFAQRNSPISLTDSGKEVSKSINAEKIISLKWDSILKTIKTRIKDDDNPYTIQEVCFNIGKNYSTIASPDDMNMIKNIAFKEGRELFDYDIIFGIEIRDKYFKDCDIKVSEIDNHDPNKTTTSP